MCRKVQFIGYNIKTAHRNSLYKDIIGLDGKKRSYLAAATYLGPDDLYKDIDFRIKIFQEAISTAASLITRKEEVLKIFMIPEFFFRPKRGAYPAGHNYYFYILERLKKATRFYKNWLFVCGTIALEAYPTKRKSSLCCCPWWGKSKKKPELIIDYSKSKELYNVCPVVKEGKILWTIMKKELSDIDFPGIRERDIHYLSTSKTAFNDWETWKRHNSNNPAKLRDDYSYAGSGVFGCGPLKIAVEICKDHSEGRLITPLLEKKYKRANIHIIISCGLNRIKQSHIVAKQNGLVFLCDGMGFGHRCMRFVSVYGINDWKKPFRTKKISDCLIPTQQMFSNGNGQVEVYPVLKNPGIRRNPLNSIPFDTQI